VMLVSLQDCHCLTYDSECIGVYVERNRFAEVRPRRGFLAYETVD